MKDPVHVLCAVNSTYIMPLCVMLTSLVIHFDPARPLVIHIIGNGISSEDRDKLRQSLLLNRPKLENITLAWYASEGMFVHAFPGPEGDRFSVDIYARILAPSLLPADCERIIYLDCDIVVLRDISALYDSTSDHAILYAVHDIATPFVSSKFGVFDYAARGLSPRIKYFNSGVMVMNLRRWRERDLTSTIVEYLVRNASHVMCQDQGGLNAILAEEWAPLDLRWNQGFDVLFKSLWFAAGYSRKEWLLARTDPYIVHFSGHKKPWDPGRKGPRYSYFYRYYDRTVYRGGLKNRPHLESLIGFRAYFWLWRAARALLPGLVKP